MIALLGVLSSLALEPIEPLPQAPALQTEPCEGSGMIAHDERVVGTVRAVVLHECGAPELRGLVAIRSAQRWFLAPAGWISLEHVSSNIIRRVTFVRDHLGSGELASGAKAVIYTIETLNGTMGALRFGRAVVCTTGPDVACSTAVAFACEADGCTAPKLSRGVLIVHDADDGEQRYAVSAGTGTEPPR